jgi:hypothetical protein
MRVKLNEHWIKILSNLPESGMGYQAVNVKLRNGKVIRNALVFNAEELEIPNGKVKIKTSEITDIKLSTKNCELVTQ